MIHEPLRHHAELLGIRPFERLIIAHAQGIRHAGKTRIAAGLQQRGSQRDRPYPGKIQELDVILRYAAGEADAQLAVESLGEAPRHLERQVEQRSAAHVHLLGGQLAVLHLHGEGVGELDAEFEALALGKSLKPAEHLDSVAPLQILLEVMIVERDIIEASLVEYPSRVFIAEDGGVALDEGVQTLLGYQIGGYALDLVGRTAVEGRERYAAADARRDVVDQLAVLGMVLLQHFLALGKDRSVGGVLQALDEVVYLSGLDALEVVADAHVEHEAVGISQPGCKRDDLDNAPCLDILFIRLLYGELGRPLAVVALVVRLDARTGDALCELLAVHDLHGL